MLTLSLLQWVHFLEFYKRVTETNNLPHHIYWQGLDYSEGKNDQPILHLVYISLRGMLSLLRYSP